MRPPFAQVEQLVRDLLDLVAPAAQPLSRSVAQPLPALRAIDAVRPGGTAVVFTTLQNDHQNDTEVGFTCTDLV